MMVSQGENMIKRELQRIADLFDGFWDFMMPTLILQGIIFGFIALTFLINRSL
jgi:hypothetical protein